MSKSAGRWMVVFLLASLLWPLSDCGGRPQTNVSRSGPQAAAGTETAKPAPRPEPPPQPLPLVDWTGKPAKDLEKIERLVKQQKFEAAAKELEKLLRAARERKDSEAWSQLLVRWVRLRMALHGYETAVRFLREQPWPEDLLAQVSLNLYYAATLVTYARSYSWEIQQREKVDTKGEVDLKAWTMEQIYGEALRAYLVAWGQREALGKIEPKVLAEFLNLGNYPKEIRSSLRDSVTHLLVELLADTQGWRPEQSNEVFTLDLEKLLSAELEGVKLDDPEVHPLLKIAAVLDDLELWHARRGEPEAALDARMARLVHLYSNFTEEADRARIKEDLLHYMAPLRKKPWWAMAQGLLAEFVQQESEPNAIRRAHQLAVEGAEAFPESPGGQRCRYLAKLIERPEFQLQGMSADAAGKKSIGVFYKNLPEIYFRAYRLDLFDYIKTADDYQLLPDYRKIAELLKTRPAHAWSVKLPPTPDFREHWEIVTPPMEKKGFYVVVASGREKFTKEDNKLSAVHFAVTDLVMRVSQEGDRAEVTLFSGESGRPVEGAELMLYRFDWQNKHQLAEKKTSDSAGRASFTRSSENYYFLLARRGEDLAVDPDQLYFYRSREPQRYGTLFFTDRSIYRPGQKILFKALLYQGTAEKADWKSAPKSKLTVRLRDANWQVVESKDLTTNDYGTASGEFVIPSGRMLGQWYLESNRNGSTLVRVEEYKRPTFEAKMPESKEALRLNRPARLEGEARYYFGLPVTGAKVRWRVTRQPVYPWWWYWYGWGAGASSQSQTVATGTSVVDEEGKFRVEFTPRADERLAEKQKELCYRYQVSADVTDEGGETNSASRAFTLGFVAVQAQFEQENNFILPDRAEKITIRRTNLDGDPAPGKGTYRLLAVQAPAETKLPVDIPLFEQPGEKPSEQTPGDKERKRWSPGYQVEALMRSWPDGEQKAQGALSHDEKGEAKLELPPLSPGVYRLRYESEDAFGAKYETQKELVVAGGRLPLALWMTPESGTVKVGGTARILVSSGLSEQPVLLETFKNGKLIKHQWLEPEAQGVIELPVGEEDRGGFGLAATAVRDHQLVTFQSSVMVPWDEKELKLSFTTFRDKLRPGQKETWTVKVTGPGEQKTAVAAAELLAYMYDRSLDAFVPHSPQSPLSLWPWRGSVPWSRTTLEPARIQWVECNGFTFPPPPPGLVGERLKYYSGYGVGGPGYRHRRVPLLNGVVTRGDEGGVAFEDDEAKPAAAPAPEAAAQATVTGSVALDGRLARLEEKEVDKTGKAGGGGRGPEPQVQIRADFSETAFFQPHLVSGPDGTARIEFSVPDSVTSWQVWVHALDRDLRSGSLNQQAESVKDLMVRPYLPRFLREGDRAELKVVVNNASEKELTGTLSFDIIDPESERSLAESFSLPAAARSRQFKVKAKGSQNFSFPVTAPVGLQTVAFKVVARAGDIGDGELRPIPVLPGRMHLVQSRFVTLKGKSRREMSFPDMLKTDDPSLIHEQLVVTLDAQLFYGVLSALPYLVNYPYECTEQTLNRFLSTGILTSLFRDYPAVERMAKEFAAKRKTMLEQWDQPDPNRKMALEETPWLIEAKGGGVPEEKLLKVLDPDIARAQRASALAKLQKAQTSSGGFPWFPGGPPSPWMTLYLLHGFSKGLEFGVDVPKDMIVRAWQYTHRHYLDQVVRDMRKENCCWEFVTFINYVLSNFPDSSWTGGVFTDEERKEMLDFSFKHWKKHSPMLKGQLALTLKRMDRAKDARLVWESVMDSAKEAEDQGVFWAPEDRGWLWYNDSIETHAFAVRTVMELTPQEKKLDGLVLWLFLNKKLNHWKSTRATAEVVYSLAHYLKKIGALGEREEATLTVAGKEHKFVFEPDKYAGKKNQIVVPGEKLDPKTCATTVAEKPGKGTMFVSATWHFSTEKLPEEARGDYLTVTRAYFKRVKSGREVTLQPLADGATLKVGDELEVQLSITSKHPMEYVHLRDPRGAGFEPVSNISRHKWNLGLYWYEEVRDSGTNFFFEQLPQGEFTFKYRLRAATAGTFKTAPATLQPMYAPEFAAYSAGHLLSVQPAE